MTNSQHSLNAIAVRFTWFLNTGSTASGAFTDCFARWSKLVACFGCGIVLALPASIRAQAVSEISTRRAIEVGAAQGGQLDAGKTLRWRIEVPAGNVVQGDFNGPGATLDLVDRHGVHIRRLADGENSPQTLTFQVQNGQQLQVQAGTLGTPFTLQLHRSLPLATKSVTDHSGLESPRLTALTRELSQGATTAEFWEERRANGAPMVEPLSATESLVTFLWRGTSHTRNVRLFGSPSGDHDPLKRLGDSDVWWASFRMPNTARLSYRLAPDVPQIQGSAMDQRRMVLATAQRDPLNTSVFPSKMDAAVDVYQGSSVLTLPQTPAQPWSALRASVPAGTLEHHVIASRILNNQRSVWIYRPATGAPKALLVLFDAHAYRHDVPTPRIVDNLIADGLIPPTAVVLIANPSAQARATELPPNPQFAQFLDEELMPWLRHQGLAQPAKTTVIAGSSYGGLASAYAALRLPHLFGRVLSMSGSYWWAPEGERPGWMMRAYAQAPDRSADTVEFYLDAGRYEAARGGREGILETNRHLGDVLRAKGFRVTQREHATGHDYVHWQGAIACGLVALLNPEQFAKGLQECDGLTN